MWIVAVISNGALMVAVDSRDPNSPIYARLLTKLLSLRERERERSNLHTQSNA